MHKVRRIFHPKLRPFHCQIMTYHLSDVISNGQSVSSVNTAILLLSVLLESVNN